MNGMHDCLHSTGHVGAEIAAMHGAAVQAPQEDRGNELVQYRTGLPLETLQAVGQQLTRIPPEFTLHPDIQKVMERRRGMVEATESRVDFAFAELLAFCTLSLRRPPGLFRSTGFPCRSQCIHCGASAPPWPVTRSLHPRRYKPGCGEFGLLVGLTHACSVCRDHSVTKRKVLTGLC